MGAGRKLKQCLFSKELSDSADVGMYCLHKKFDIHGEGATNYILVIVHLHTRIAVCEGLVVLTLNLANTYIEN